MQSPAPLAAVAVAWLVRRIGKRFNPSVQPHPLHHAQAIPRGIHGIQYAIMYRPGPAPHAGPLLGLAKRSAAVKGLVQSAAGLELFVNIIHQLVPAYIGKTPPLKHPR